LHPDCYTSKSCFFAQIFSDTCRKTLQDKAFLLGCGSAALGSSVVNFSFVCFAIFCSTSCSHSVRVCSRFVRAFPRFSTIFHAISSPGGWGVAFNSAFSVPSCVPCCRRFPAPCQLVQIRVISIQLPYVSA